jgi:hypothetical protein
MDGCPDRVRWHYFFADRDFAGEGFACLDHLAELAGVEPLTELRQVLHLGDLDDLRNPSPEAWVAPAPRPTWGRRQ